MIETKHKLPCKFEMSLIMHDCDYNYYIPWEVLMDLINLHICNGLNQPIHTINKLPSYIPNGKENFYKLLQELYSNLDYNDFDGITPAHKAVYTLKSLASLVDFRKLDKHEEDYLKPPQNYVEILNDQSVKILVKEDGEINNDDIAKIVKLSSKITSVLPNRSSEDIEERSNLKIKSYGDIKKARKSSMIRPDFKQKLANLKLIITGKIHENPQEDVFIYLEDASSSMIDNKGLIISKAIQLALLKDPKPVHYYRYAGKYLEFHTLNTLEEKINCFSSSKIYKPYNCDYSSLIDLIEKTYSRGNVIISTDGIDYIPYRKTNLIYNCVCVHTEYFDSNMRNFVIGSGGKYISL